MGGRLYPYTDRQCRPRTVISFAPSYATIGGTITASFVPGDGGYHPGDDDHYGSGDGFAIEVNQLKIGVRYYYRAYAVNEVGLAMGSIKKFVASGGVTEESPSGTHEHCDPWVGGESIEDGWLNVDWFGAILPF